MDTLSRKWFSGAGGFIPGDFSPDGAFSGIFQFTAIGEHGYCHSLYIYGNI